MQTSSKKPLPRVQSRAGNSFSPMRQDTPKSRDDGGHRDIQRMVGNQAIQRIFKSRMNQALGLDTASIPLIKYSNSARELALDTYTDGHSIHARDSLSETSPDDQFRLAHEYAHIAQRRMGLVKASGRLGEHAFNSDARLEKQADDWAGGALRGEKSLELYNKNYAQQDYQPILQGDDLYTVGVQHDTFIYQAPVQSPLLPQASHTNYVDEQPARLKFLAGTDVALTASQGEWLEVVGEAFSENNVSQGRRRGWILRTQTNLAPAGDAATENDRIAQDLDDFLDQYLIPALATWRVAIRTSGNAYLTAFTNYRDALTLADQQAQARADFYAAVLTVVGVGALGWLGDVAQAGRTFTGLMRSSAVRGSIEDAIQTGLGEGIDIVQGGWFGSHINRETHPLRYLNGQLLQMDALEADLTRHVGESKSSIRRSSSAFDRAAVLVELFDWWNDARAKNTPNTEASSEGRMARVLETGFWIKYINTVLTRHPYYVFWGPGLEYTKPEDAVIARFRELGMMRMAGIEEWDNWPYQGPGPDYEGDTPYFGSDATSQIAQWAREYTLPTFD